MMQRKLAKYGMMQGMGGMGGMGGMMPTMPMMPMMPCLPACPMPCLPACNSAPMMAAACPLPCAQTPLIQNMYPSATMNSLSLMTPSSFMSSLPASSSYSFPNNVGMVMTLPSSAPNPLLSASTFGGFSPQFSPSGGMACCCCYCTPPAPPPPPQITYYPRPVSVPQPYPVPCPAPVAIPNVQQVPVPRPVSVIAPPIMADCSSPCSIQSGAPLMSSQGGFTQSGFNQPMVMGSRNISTQDSLFSDRSGKTKRPLYKPSIETRHEKAQRIAASLSKLGVNDNLSRKSVSNRTKHRTRSTRYDDLSDNISVISLPNNKYLSRMNGLSADHLLSVLNESKYKQGRRRRNS